MDSDVLGDDDYRELLRLRTELRRLLHAGEEQVRAAGITTSQHQLLLVVRGHVGASGPTIRDVADQLLLRHHSTVELVQRAERAGLLVRRQDASDARLVRLELSPAGRAVLDSLTSVDASQLAMLSGRSLVRGELRAVEQAPVNRPAAPVGPVAGSGAAGGGAGAGAARQETVGKAVEVWSVRDPRSPGRGRRVLVDRTWPHGMRADDTPFDEWLGAIAPSAELRRWSERNPQRFEELAHRYGTELEEYHGADLDRLASLAHDPGLVLVTDASDLDHCPAAVLGDLVASRALET